LPFEFILKNTMKFPILGAGALGTAFGGMLATAGYEAHT